MLDTAQRDTRTGISRGVTVAEVAGFSVSPPDGFPMSLDTRSACHRRDWVVQSASAARSGVRWRRSRPGVRCPGERADQEAAFVIVVDVDARDTDAEFAGDEFEKLQGSSPRC